MPFNRFDHSEELDDYIPLMIDGLPVVEYGVSSGSTLKRALDKLDQYNKKYSKIYGFDSWEGLPDTINQEWFAFDWQPGSFSAKKMFGVKTTEEVLLKLREIIGRDVVFVSGWFKDTLTKECADNLKIGQAMYVNIDVDIYSSTMEVLKFCEKNRVIDKGTIFRFDDWLSGDSTQGNR